MTRTIGGGERPSGRVLCPRDLAGKSLRCTGCQPEGSRRYRTIHAGDRQLAWPRRPVRSETCRSTNSVLLSSNFGRRAKWAN